jgi:hypothetical protein
LLFDRSSHPTVDGDRFGPSRMKIGPGLVELCCVELFGWLLASTSHDE